MLRDTGTKFYDGLSLHIIPLSASTGIFSLRNVPRSISTRISLVETDTVDISLG